MPLRPLDFAIDLLDRADALAKIAGTPSGNSWVPQHDVLRSAWIFVGSSVDTYFHERVRKTILVTPMSSSGMKYSVSLGAMEGMVSNFLSDRVRSRPRVSLLNAVHEALLRDTFQGSTNIETAFKLIGVKGYWAQISQTLGEPTQSVKDRLNRQYARRNRIAHQGDYTRQSRPQQLWLDYIDRAEVNSEIAWTRAFLAAADSV